MAKADVVNIKGEKVGEVELNDDIWGTEVKPHLMHDVVVMQLLDPKERSFDFSDAATFEDVESGARLPVVPSRLRGEYQRLISEHVATMQRRLGEHRIDYTYVDTSKPLDAVLFDYLLRRERLRTVK